MIALVNDIWLERRRLGPAHRGVVCRWRTRSRRWMRADGRRVVARGGGGGGGTLGGGKFTKLSGRFLG